jgi:hypothetical protein
MTLMIWAREEKVLFDIDVAFEEFVRRILMIWLVKTVALALAQFMYVSNSPLVVSRQKH